MNRPMNGWMRGRPLQWVLLGALLVLGSMPSAWAQNTFPASGNVGIGTAAPAKKLVVNETGSDWGAIIRGAADGSESPGGIFVGSRLANKGTIQGENGSGGVSDLLLQTEGGNVGIGTVSPGKKLELAVSVPDQLIRLTDMSIAHGMTTQVPTTETGDIGEVSTYGGLLYRGYSAGDNQALLFEGNNGGTGTLANAPVEFRAYKKSGTTQTPVVGSDAAFTFAAGLSPLLTIRGGGNVGIGTTTPAALLHVAGNAQVDGNIAAKYQDVAEWVPTTGTLGPGTVVVIDPQERNRVLPAAQPYDSRVAGVVSARPGLLLGEAGDDKAKVAQSGRVSVKVDASYGPIAVGDLLVTSPTPGHAMRSVPVDLGGVAIHRPGTLLGKALEPLAEGQGEILVLLTLQ